MPNSHTTFRAYLQTLLEDRHPAVLSAALVAWEALYPDSIDLLHQPYRRICYALGDMDEYGQQEALGVLGLYARRCFVSPPDQGKGDPDLELLLNRTEDLLMSRNASVSNCVAHIQVSYEQHRWLRQRPVFFWR